MSFRYRSILMAVFLASGNLIGCATNCNDAQSARLRALQPGETVTVSVEAGKFWNGTGIRLVSGAQYELSVDGEQYWSDAWLRRDAEGYDAWWLRWAEGFRRLPKANWITLIGAIAPNCDDLFVIGKRLVYVAKTDGELMCFANDAWLAYWNNFGSLQLSIRRREGQ